MPFFRVRYGLILVALGFVAAACGSATQASPDDDPVAASGSAQASTTTMVFVEASATEQQKFDQMFQAALADGVMSAGELELFALEAVQYTKRAGIDSTLDYFDAQTGNITFSVAAEGPEDTASDLVGEGCQNTFYVNAFTSFSEFNGPAK